MHASDQSLLEKLQEAGAQILVNHTYAHYKNPLHTYIVLTLAIGEADEEAAVVYQAQYGEELTFTRSAKSWLDDVEWNGQVVKRFLLTK